MDSLVKQKTVGFRKQGGLALVTLVALIAVLIVGPLCLAAYEVVEYNFCQLQLKHCVDSAALAAGCGLTESTSSSISLNEQYAMNQALFMFQQNTILGKPLATATSSYATGAGANNNNNVTVSGNQSALYFQFIDPYTGNQVGFGGAPVTNAAGQATNLNTAGKIIRVTGYFGFQPQFATFVGLKNSYTVTATSDAGLPQLDLVFCFDTSCSMDDFTNIALVNRYQNSTTSRFDALAQKGNHWDYSQKNGYTLVDVGQLNSLFGATNDINGCSANAGYPQQADTYPGKYSPNIQGHGGTFNTIPYLSQTPSSNFPSGTFTDLVIPLDGNGCTTAVTVSVGGPIYGGTFTFPAGMQGIAVLVEAERGNLDNPAYAQNVQCYTAGNLALGSNASNGVTCQRGWFQAYFSASMSVVDQQNPLNISLNTPINFANNIIYYTAPVSAGGVNPLPLRHPVGDCVAAVENFFQAVWNDADVHFGLVVYNDQVGRPTNPNGTVADPSLFSGTPDSNPNNVFTAGTPTPGASDYTTPVTGLYSYLAPIIGYGGTATFAASSPQPPDRLLVPIPQLVLQKSPGPSLSCSLFDTTVPPTSVAHFSSVNYCLYDYSYFAPNCNPTAAGTFPPYCVEPFGGTNMSAAINAAVAQFAPSAPGGGSRLGATPAIVLFTDGVPSAPDTAAAAATAAAQAGRTALNLQAIPIFCVGLAAIQAAGFQTQQLSCLQGISSASGIGAATYQVVVSNPTMNQTQATSPWNPLNANSAGQQLDTAFQNVARQLVGLLN